MQLLKDSVSEQQNPEMILNTIPLETPRKLNSVIFSEDFFFIACGLLTLVITILLTVGIQTLGSAVWGRIQGFPLASSFSVVAAIAASAIIVLFLIKLLQFGRQLFQAFWASLT